MGIALDGLANGSPLVYQRQQTTFVARENSHDALSGVDLSLSDRECFSVARDRDAGIIGSGFESLVPTCITEAIRYDMSGYRLGRRHKSDMVSIVGEGNRHQRRSQRL